LTYFFLIVTLLSHHANDPKEISSWIVIKFQSRIIFAPDGGFYDRQLVADMITVSMSESNRYAQTREG